MSKKQAAPPPAPRLCPTCGTRVGDAATKCIVCGADLTLDKDKSSQKRKQTPAHEPISSPIVATAPILDSEPVPEPEPESKPPPTIQPVGIAQKTNPPAGRRFGRIPIPLPAFIGGIAILALLLLTVFLFSSGLAGTNDATPTITQTSTPPPTFTPPPASTNTPVPTNTPLPALIHIVAQGDTCTSIAVVFNVSVQSILELNGFPQSCPLFVGQEVSVPQPTATPVPTPTNTLPPLELTQAARPTHVVGSGESLSSIATFFGVDFNVMAEVNGKLPPDYAITIGELLVIPDDVPAPTAGPTPTSTPLPPYAAPRLLNPPDGAAISSVEQTVTLQWASVGLLQDNETYLVTVEDVTANSARRVQVTTLTTRYIVGVELKPFEAVPHVFKWTIVAARQVGTTDGGEPIYEPAGATSLERTFSWTGIGIVPTPTNPAEQTPSDEG